MVVVLAVLGALLGLALACVQQPLYRARTSVDIQALNESFLNLHAVSPTGQPGADSLDSYIQTQIRLMESDTIVERTKDRLRRAAEARRTPSGDTTKSRATREEQTLLEDAARRLKIHTLGATRLVEAVCESPDPQLASAFCNTLVNEFIQVSMETHNESAVSTSAWLAQQLEELKAKLANSEAALQANAQASSMFYSQGKESVGEARLRQLQDELSRAQADRMVKQAQHSTSLSANPDSLPSVLDSSSLKDLKARLVDLKRQMAELSSLTANAPKVQKLQSQINEVQSSLAKERRNVVQRLRNEYASANSREKLLAKAYSAQEAVVSREIGRASHYQMLKAETDSQRQLYASLLQRVKEAGFATALRASSIHVIDAAKTPTQPFSPRKLLNAASGFAIGACFGLALALFLSRTDRRLRLPGDSMSLLKVRELGVIPAARADRFARSRKSPTLLMGKSDASSAPMLNIGASLTAEAYRAAVSSLLFEADHGEHGKVFVVSSPSAGEGKTTLASNMGIALAEARKRVLLIDGDLRRPMLDKLFDLGNEAGLRDVLRGDINVTYCPMELIAQPTFVPDLFVLLSGPGTDQILSLLHSPNLHTLLARVRNDFDVILIDTPPMLHLADARLLARFSDGVVMVVRSGSTTAEQASSAHQMFALDGTRVVGVLLNDFNPVRESRYGYYKSYYDYQKKA
ncbi:MAG: exopolysaccharide regulatory tyrosine autokinase VpsO [Vulcanimicrobiaceae bacterium]